MKHKIFTAYIPTWVCLSIILCLSFTKGYSQDKPRFTVGIEPFGYKGDVWPMSAKPIPQYRLLSLTAGLQYKKMELLFGWHEWENIVEKYNTVINHNTYTDKVFKVGKSYFFGRFTYEWFNTNQYNFHLGSYLEVSRSEAIVITNRHFGGVHRSLKTTEMHLGIAVKKKIYRDVYLSAMTGFSSVVIRGHDGSGNPVPRRSLLNYSPLHTLGISYRFQNKKTIKNPGQAQNL